MTTEDLKKNGKVNVSFTWSKEDVDLFENAILEAYGKEVSRATAMKLVLGNWASESLGKNKQLSLNTKK